MAGFRPVGRQQVRQLGAAEQRRFIAFRQVVPFQRHGAVHAVEGAGQGIFGQLAARCQQGGGIARRTVHGLRENAGGVQGIGLGFGQRIVAAVQRNSGGFGFLQPGLQRLHKVAPLLPAGVLQRRHGAVPQQRGQHGAVGPVAVEAAAQGQGIGALGDAGAGSRCRQQGVAHHVHPFHQAVGFIVQRQQIGRRRVLGDVEGHFLGGGIVLQRRQQGVGGVDVQGLGLRGGRRFHRCGMFGRAQRIGGTAGQQQRRQGQRRKANGFQHRANFLTF